MQANLSIRIPSRKSASDADTVSLKSCDYYPFSPYSSSSGDMSMARNSFADGKPQKKYTAERLGSQFANPTQKAMSGLTKSEEPPRRFRQKTSNERRNSLQQSHELKVTDDSTVVRQSTSKRVSRRQSIFQPPKHIGRESVGARSSDHPQNHKENSRNSTNYQTHQQTGPRTSNNRFRFSQHHEVLTDLKTRKPKGRRPPLLPTKIFSPLDRFRRMVRLVRLLIRCLVDYQRITIISHTNQMSFAMLSNDMVTASTYRHGLTFDPKDYKVAKETLLNDKLRDILTILPQQRSKVQNEYALKCLRSEVEEFAEFPIKMQQALVEVAWLDEFEPKRIIIRQGHKAETFYFIIYGTALITRNRINSNGEGYVETVSILQRGKSFGELAIMRREQRANNVVSQTRLGLLTVDRKNFIKIFMHRMEGEEPEFISFLRKLPAFQNYPLSVIPQNKPTICAFTYFRVGVVICADSSKSDAIVIVRSGVCRVIKRLRASKPNITGLKYVPKNYIYKSIKGNTSRASFSQHSFGEQRPILLTSPSSPVSLLIGPNQPTLRKRFTLSLIQAGKPSLSEDPSLKAEFTISRSLSAFRKANNRKNTCEDHKRQIREKYRKWQDEHPITRETLLLLMTGKEINDEDDQDDEPGDDLENRKSRITLKEEINSNALKRQMSKDGVSRSPSRQSSFRTQILKRRKTSLTDAWLQQHKTSSTVSSSLPSLNESLPPRFIQSSRSQGSNFTLDKPIYIHVETLRQGDIFGLLPLVFGTTEGATPMSLVSDGAECILINKDFFAKHFDNEMRENLVRMIQPYPSEETMQANVQNQTNWDAFKFMTVHSHVINRSLVKESRN